MRWPRLFPTGEEQVHGKGEQGGEWWLIRESLDLVIMNPPFTRPTNHESTDVPRPDFAGLDNDNHAQRLMGDRLKQLRQGLTRPVGDGNAGLGSYFADLAHLKLRDGGRACARTSVRGYGGPLLGKAEKAPGQ